MKSSDERRDEQRSTVYVGMLLFSLVLLLLQMWLFVATLNNFLDGRYAVAIPAVAVSFLCLGVNIWMLVGLSRMESSK